MTWAISIRISCYCLACAFWRWRCVASGPLLRGGHCAAGARAVRFYWGRLLRRIFILDATSDGRSVWKGLLVNVALFLPAAIAADIAMVFQNSDAVRQAIAATPIDSLIKEQLAAQTFEPSFGQMLAHMGHL